MEKFWDIPDDWQPTNGNQHACFVEFRVDGWPTCPKCGEDELWSPIEWKGDTHPTAQEYVEAGLSCLVCGWSNSPVKKIKIARRGVNCPCCLSPDVTAVDMAFEVPDGDRWVMTGDTRQCDRCLHYFRPGDECAATRSGEVL